MTLSEKKIELVQGLLLLQDKTALFEIEKLILNALKSKKKPNVSNLTPFGTQVDSFETWNAQFEATKEDNLVEDSGMNILEFRKRIWTAEQGSEMNFNQFLKLVSESDR